MLLQEELSSGENWTLFRGKLPHLQGTTLIMKYHKEGDYELTEDFNSPLKLNRWLLQPIEKVTSLHEEIIVFEDFQGVSLEMLLKTPMSLPTFFRIAEELTNAFIMLHHEKWYYHHLNPLTILVHPKTFQVKLLPMNSLSYWGLKGKVDTNLYEMTFKAPEQFSIQYMDIDERTDLYTLGAIFYRMLIGKMYDVETVEQFMFELMTKPYSLHKITEKYNEPMLEKVLAKLLAKNAHERYQSAYSLKKDLQLLQQQKLKTIALTDTIMNPQPTNSLIGREKAKSQLVHMLQKCLEGEKQFAIIQGHSGVGKTSVAYSIQQPIIENHGYLIECKFEEKQESQTQLFINPFRQLCKQVYFRGESAIERFQQLFIWNELVITADVLKILPELQLLIKGLELSENEKVSPFQQQHYLLTVFQKLLAIFSALNEPIVLIIDDCQWADEAALGYFEKLFKNHQHGHFFIIATERTSEQKCVDFPLVKNEITIINVENLNEIEVNEWLSKSIQLREDMSIPLAKRMFQFTEGNPFYLKKLFIEMLRHQAIYFDTDFEIWRINESLLNEVLADKTFAQFIITITNKLRPELLNILQIAACIGYTFDTATIMRIARFSVREWQLYCEELIDGGYIIHTHKQGFFQFIHGSIQETVYQQMEPSFKQQMHYEIGQYYLTQDKKYSKEQIVSQLNLCTELLTQEERLFLLNWNIELAEKSSNIGLFLDAIRMYSLAKLLLPNNHWALLHEQSIKTFRGIGECAYVTNNRELAEYHFEQAIANTNTIIEKLEIYLIRIYLYVETEQYDTAFAIMRNAFQLCKIDIPLQPSKKDIALEFIKLHFILKYKKDDEITSLKTINNKEIELLIKMICTLLGGSFRMEANVMSLYLFRALRLTLKYGVIKESALLFINFALISTLVFAKKQQGDRFSLLALKLVENVTNLRLKARVYFIYSGYYHFAVNNKNLSLQYLQESQRYSSQLAVQAIYNFSSILYVLILWHKNVPLREIYELICIEQQKLQLYPSLTATNFLQELKHCVDALRTGNIEWNSTYTNNSDEGMVVLHSIYRMQMSYLFENEAAAREIMKNTKNFFMEKKSTILSTPFYFFYEALWKIDFIKASDERHLKKQYNRAISKTFSIFKRLNQMMPQKYNHIYFLLLAEITVLRGNVKKAALLFDHALQIAKLNHYTFDLGLIYERTSKFYQFIGDSEKEMSYLTLAIENMEKWGATVVADRWKKRLGHYSFISQEPKLQPIHTELFKLVDSVQMLAKEIKMEKLIERLLSILLKQVNATTAYFLIVENSRVLLKGILRANGSFMYKHNKSTPPSDIQTIAQFVLQCDETVLLKNVQSSTLFQQIKSNVKSMLCTPIYYQGKIIAIVYLENEFLYNAFYEEQLQVIELIATQAAVSIINANIYEELEERVALRTKQLEEMNFSLVQVNEELARKENEREKIFQSISHELRSPITSTLGYINAILDGIVSEDKRDQYLQRSYNRLLEMKRLIDDLFDLAKLEAGRSSFEMAQVKVTEFAHACINFFQIELQSTSLDFDYYCNVSEDIFINIDISRMQQVFNNLLHNAIKYTKHGFISFHVYEQQDHIVFELHDTGIGVAEQDLPFIFDHFYSSDKTKDYDSTGIGLAICKQIVVQHDGKIMAESKVEKGSVFKIILPLERLDNNSSSNI